MTRNTLRWISVSITLIFILGVIILTSSPRAAAQEDRGEWFKSLRQPDTGISCCDISDCRVTQSAEWRADGWWAEVNGVMTKIPERKIIYNRPPLPDGAVICHGTSGVIFCFVPPAMGT